MEPSNQPSDKRKRSLSKKLTPEQTLWAMRQQTLREWRGEKVLNPNRNIHNASEHLDKLLAKVGVKGGLDEQKLRHAWAAVAGDFVAKHAEPESLKNGVLVLTVIQPSMRFHLEQMKGQLLKNFRKELGAGVVKQVRFKIG